MKLFELFAHEELHEGWGKPVRWRWTEQSKIEFVAEFAIKPVKYTVSLFRADSSRDLWELSFAAATKKQDFGFQVSGTGNAWSVYGTVIDIATKFVGLKRPKIVQIDSDVTERSRFAVNQRVAKTLAQNVGYHVSVDDEDNLIIAESENSLNEVARPQTRQDANRVLAAAGYERLGHGMFGAVYGRAGRPYVLKVFSAKDQGYLDFLSLARANQSNPHFPRFYGNLVRVTPVYYAVRMEKLGAFDPHRFGDVGYALFDYIQDGADEAALASYPELKAACDLVRTRLLSRYHFDHKDGSFMVRGNDTIVITDPVLDLAAKDELRWDPEPLDPPEASSRHDDDELLRQIMGEGLKTPTWSIPDPPGTTPIPDDHVRLYHQTAEQNLGSIRKNGIMMKHAAGTEGPRAIYADPKGFYGSPDERPTVEFSVPKERWQVPFVQGGDVAPESIIAVHKPWHKVVRTIENSPTTLDAVLQGKRDRLLKDPYYGKAIRFVKRKYAGGTGRVDEGLKNPKWEVPAPPGTTPVPDDHVRLYHQTAEKNLGSIRKNGIQLRHALGVEGPRAIYADPRGFYGKPEDSPTVEFSVHKDRWTPPFVNGDVAPDSIIAVHKPWHDTVRYIEDEPNTLKAVLSGQHDDLLGDPNYAKAIRFIKHKYRAA